MLNCIKTTKPLSIRGIYEVNYNYMDNCCLSDNVENDTIAGTPMTKASSFLVEDDDIIYKTTEWRLKKLGDEVSRRISCKTI